MKIQIYLNDPKTNWKYILIVVVLAVIVGGGILGYQYWWLPKIEIPVSTLIFDKTANWKTYRNEEYGFEIKYPPEWEVTENPKVSPYNAEIVSIKDKDLGAVKINLQSLSDGTDNPNVRFEYEMAIINSRQARLQKFYVKNQLRQKSYEIKIGDNIISMLLMPNRGVTFDVYNQILSTFRFLE